MTATTNATEPAAAPATTTDAPTSEPTVTPQFCPLLGGHLRIRVDIAPPEGSPFPPSWAVVTPFTPAEGAAYVADINKLKEDPVQQDAEQRKRITARVKEWNFSITRSDVAPINPGTMSVVPTWAFLEIELAVMGLAGKFLGN